MNKHDPMLKGLAPFLAALLLLAACSPGGPAAETIAYNLGETTILQDHFAEDSRFRQMPVRLEGVIGVPGEKGPRPVVLILHGSHQVCPSEDVWPCPPEEEQPNYTGFAYLVEALADAGYIALAINVNAEHTFAYGESPPTVRTIQLIDAHLGELAAAHAGESEAFGVDLQGRVDLSRLVWMGHSRGGDFANWIVRDQNLASEVSPAGYGPVQGLILIAPSAFATDALPSVDLPFAALLPACDGDVSTLSGQLYYESARRDPDRQRWATTVYLDGANHNHFNAILEPEAGLPDRPDCAGEAMLPAEDQQDFLVQYTFDFLRALYGDAKGASAARQRLGIDPSTAVPSELYGYPVRLTVSQPAASRLALIQPQSEAELEQNLLGGQVTLGGATALFCPSGYYVPANEPLEDFAGIDLSKVEQVALIFDQQDTGTLFLADVELVAAER